MLQYCQIKIFLKQKQKMLKENRLVFKMSGAPSPEPEAVTQAEVDDAAAVAEVRQDALAGTREDMEDYKAEMQQAMDTEVAGLRELSGEALVGDERFAPSRAEVAAGLAPALASLGMTAAEMDDYLTKSPEEIVDTVPMSKLSSLFGKLGIEANVSQLVEAAGRVKEILRTTEQQIEEQIAAQKRDARIAELPDEYLGFPEGKVFTDPESPYPQLEADRAALKEAKEGLLAVKKQLAEYEEFQALLQVKGWLAACKEIQEEMAAKTGEITEEQAALATLIENAQQANDLVVFAERNIQELEASLAAFKAEMEAQLAAEKARLESLEGDELTKEFPVTPAELEQSVEAYFQTSPTIFMVGRVTPEDYQAYKAGRIGELLDGKYMSEDGGIDINKMRTFQMMLTSLKDGVRLNLAGKKRDAEVVDVTERFTTQIAEREARDGQRVDQMQSGRVAMEETATRKTEMAQKAAADLAADQQELAALEEEFASLSPDSERVGRKKEEIAKRMRRGGGEEEAPKKSA